MAQKAEGVTIGFLGTGAMDVDSATDLIEELIEATISSEDDPVRFIFPLTTEEFTDTLEELVHMAKESEITYEVVSHTGDKGRRAFVDIAGAAAKTYHVADPFTQMEQILTEAPSAVLLVLWDAEREEELGEIVGRFLDAGLDVRDLTDGNAPLAMGEEVNGEEPIPATTAEGEIIATAEATQDAVVLYSEAELGKLSRNDIKEIAAKLGLPPRRSSAAMIEEILEAQESEEEKVGGPVEEHDIEMIIPQEMELTTGGLVEAISAFPGRLHDVLDQFITDFAKTFEGLIFNTTPESQPEPQPEPQPAPQPEPAPTEVAASSPRRRLRSRS